MADQDPFAQYAGTSAADPFAAYAVAGGAPAPKPGERTRVDTNAVGVNHEMILRGMADKAAKYLPASMAPAAAFLGTALADIPLSALEMFSSPESLAMAGAGGATSPAKMPLRVDYAPTPIRGALRMAGSAIKQTPSGAGGGLTTKIVGNVLERVPVPKTFQDLPLSQQMESLGEVRPNPMTTRSGGPIGQEVGTPTPFHELPLSRQVESLPQRGPMPTGRQGTPPLRTETPFHERPLYQQMEELANVPSVTGSQRTGMPPPQGGMTIEEQLAQATTANGYPLPPEVLARLRAKLAGHTP